MHKSMYSVLTVGGKSFFLYWELLNCNGSRRRDRWNYQHISADHHTGICNNVYNSYRK